MANIESVKLPNGNEYDIKDSVSGYADGSYVRRNITNDLANLTTAISERNLAKYDYKIGDYFTRTYTYVLADMNPFYGASSTKSINANHLGIVVVTSALSQWHTGNAASVGYSGSALHSYLSGTVLDNIKADMIALFGGSTGLEHLYSHSKLFTTGATSWAWISGQYISALTCTQIDAGSQCTMNGFQEGEASKSLEVFRKFKWTEIFGTANPWLRNLGNNNQNDTSASYACFVHQDGLLNGDGGLTNSLSAVGLILLH